jgi:hypothetical protein
MFAMKLFAVRRPIPTWGMWVVLMLAGALLALGPAGAHEHGSVSTIAPAEGEILSFACGSLPEDAAFEVMAYSDDDLNLQIAQAFTDSLVEKGYGVTAGAPFAVMIDTQIELGRFETTRGSLGRLKIKNGGVEVRLNVWSSSQGSLLTGRQEKKTRDSNRLHITATLRHLASGEALWRGEAEGAIGAAQPLAVGRALVPALAEAFGCSARLDDIDLPEQ